VKTTDPVALDQWYPIDNLDRVTDSAQRCRILGADLTYRRDADGSYLVCEEAGRDRRLPVTVRYGLLWATLGDPRPLFDIPEADEGDRRYVACGWVGVHTSAPRIVENFLDMAHFPFIHNGILGVEDFPQVPRYDSRVRPEVDEVWSTGCRFYQPQVTAGSEGALADITYRVPAPFQVMLYRVPPPYPDRVDVIALFVQPVEEDYCRAQAVEWLVDRTSTDAQLRDFETTIFLQDRIVLENQRPRLIPLDPKAETPMRADTSSVTYRRWLREKGLVFATAAAAASRASDPTAALVSTA
jgi:phenylpropionate dioxygenase-like ring-hydroxylating dioxygenase large terminal subunit